MIGDENLWYVKTGDGDVHRVTLDQLDEAFQAGRIDQNVMVLGGGATRWTTLGQLAGLDEPAPPPPRRAPAPPAAFLPSSLRPVSLDLSLDLDDENVFRKKSRKGLVVGTLVAFLAVVGGVLGANRGHMGGFSLASLTGAAAVPPPPAPVEPPPEVAAAPAPTPPPSAAPAASTDPNAAKLSDDQKAKLAAADKALDLKSKSHKKGHATGGGAAYHPSGKSKSQGFTTGGNKFDPLNASF